MRQIKKCDQFVVINTGEQFKLNSKCKLRIEKLPQEEGKSIEFKVVFLDF